MTEHGRHDRPGAEVTHSRREVLTGATAAALAAVLPGRALPDAPPAVDEQLRTLEREHSARLGVFAHDTGTGRTVRYRADERFPLCSTFKTIAVAAVLRDRDPALLATVLHYTEAYVTAAGYAPITGLPDNVARGMTVADLCAAAITHSDNGAANLILRELGGPTAVTRFCRSLGDRTTRLDRREPALNSAEPGRTTDTSTPCALGTTYARLALGPALDPPDRHRLTGWLLANTTSTHRFRAGLPADWHLADKTGTGAYGTTNDVGITWPPGRHPIVLAVLSTKPDPTAPADEPLLAATAALLASTLSSSA